MNLVGFCTSITRMHVNCAPIIVLLRVSAPGIFCWLINNGHKFIYKIAFGSFIRYDSLLCIYFCCLFSLYSQCSLWIHVNMKLEVQSHPKIVFFPKNKIKEKGISRLFVCFILNEMHVKLSIERKQRHLFHRIEMYSNIGRRPFASDRNVNFTHIINMLVNLFWWFVSWALNCSNIR